MKKVYLLTLIITCCALGWEFTQAPVSTNTNVRTEDINHSYPGYETLNAGQQPIKSTEDVPYFVPKATPTSLRGIRNLPLSEETQNMGPSYREEIQPERATKSTIHLLERRYTN
jgi:hypothetical protein